MSASERPGELPGDRLRQMIAAYQVSQAVHVAAALGLADHLRDGPESGARLAELTGADEGALCRLLRGLAGVGIFAEVAPKRFALTPLAEPLRTGTPDSLHGLAMLHGQDWMWRPWGRLRESVLTGGTAFEAVFGERFFARLQRDPDARAVFQAAMPASNIPAAVVGAYDFTGLTVIVDVGGGQGDLIAAILRAHPELRGVLVDRPAMLTAARPYLTAAGVVDRCDIVAGDFFESVHSGADGYVLSQILHDWDDTAAVSILTNVRRAMDAGGRLLVVERIASATRRGPLLDLNMLVLLGGQERTRDEYEALLDKAGFRLTRVLDTAAGWSIIESAQAS